MNMQSYMKQLKAKRRKQGGFTLVELMVVVAVIAILAAIAMPQFMSAAGKAKEVKAKADIQTITNAAQLYMIDKGDGEAPTVETLYKEGYLAEKVKTAKGGDYTITFSKKDGSSVNKVSVTAEDAAGSEK